MTTPATDVPDINLDRFRDYLCVLARGQIGEHVRGKVDASDIVQQTLLSAHRHQATYRGNNDAQLAGWLRTILGNTLNMALRSLGREKRDVQRERSLQDAIEASSARLEQFLVAEQSSPSQRLRNHEDLLHLAHALTDLSDGQREAVLLRHCQGLSVVETAQRMGISAPTVVGLLKRGTRKLREYLEAKAAQSTNA